MLEELTDDPNQSLSHDGLETINENSTIGCEVLCTYGNVESIQLPSCPEDTSAAYLKSNNVKILNVSGFEYFEDDIFVIVHRGINTSLHGGGTNERHINNPDFNSNAEAISSHFFAEEEKIPKFENAVKCINVCGFENIEDGKYIIIRLSEERKSIKEIPDTPIPTASYNLLTDSNVQNCSTPIGIQHQPFSNKMNNSAVIANILNADGIDDGLYLLYPINKSANGPDESIIDAPEAESQNLDFSLTQASAQEQSLTDSMNNDIKIVRMSGMAEIQDGFYLCVPSNENKIDSAKSIVKLNMNMSLIIVSLL